MRFARILLGITGVALGLLAYQVQIDNLEPLGLTTDARALSSVAAGWAFIFAGIAAWSRRTRNRIGPLMIAAGFALLMRQLRYSHDPLAFTAFLAVGEVCYALVAHSVLAYPTGYVRDKVERIFLGVVYTVTLVFPLGILLFYDGTEKLRYFDPLPRESLLLVSGNADVTRVLQDVYAALAYGLLAGTFVLLVARRWFRSSPRARRTLGPLLFAAGVAALRAVFDSVVTFSSRPPAVVYDNLFWWQIGALIALPIVMLIGLLRARLAHAGIADLVLRLGRTPPDEVRDELALALGDPSLEVLFWQPDRREFTDAAGVPATVPADGPDRAVTRLEHDGEPIAALVHDPALREEPELIEAAGAAASLALENARLHYEVQAQLAKVTESRARLVAAADEERRRVERDLHDGAQQRLVALALELRSAQKQLSPEADPLVEHVLISAADEVQVAVAELRELARGIHPPILTEGGLAAALESLASRTPLRVSIDADPERLAPAVEATAYFVACEALANVTKHAHASSATIEAHRHNGTLVIAVTDDGIGGAHADGGSGLRGLADRVEAHGGRLRVESPRGGGTRVVGEIPCAS
jgi:signal transduction histidine kinase